MEKYILVEISSSGGATLHKNPSDQTVPVAFFCLSLFVISCLFTYFFIFQVKKLRRSKINQPILLEAVVQTEDTVPDLSAELEAADSKITKMAAIEM